MENCKHKEISETHLFSMYYCVNCQGRMSKRTADELESTGSIVYRSKVYKRPNKKERRYEQNTSDNNYKYILKKDGIFWDKTCTCDYCPMHNNKKYKDIIDSE